MSLSLGWLQQLKREWTIPEVIAERCVHSHCEVASCTRCVDACPHEAWLLDDASLKIDTARCDGCGLCVAACTESALVGRTPAVEVTPVINPRQFLRKPLTLSAEQSMAAPVALPPIPLIPTFSVENCNGCDACVQLCPHQALQLAKHEDGQALAYQVQAERCTGCGICVDVCERDAVTVRQMERMDSAEILLEIPLEQARCKACGSHFHYPVDGDTVRQYCQICAHTNHHRQLFQVY